MPVGSRIAQLRKAKGWTQATLAKQAKMSASSIAMYETNRRVPDESTLAKLAKALQIPKSVLMSDEAIEAIEKEKEKKKPTVVKKKVTRTEDNGTLLHSSARPSKEEPDLTTLSISREEARIILFLRMNPKYMPFFEDYIVADERKRVQLERTWRLIHDFQM